MAIDEGTSQVSTQEMGQRITRLRRKMIENGLDHYICADPANVYYLTNFANYVHERPFLLVISEDAVDFIVPILEVRHIESQRVGAIEFRDYLEFPAPAGQRWSDRLADVVRAGARTGIESLCPAYLAAALGDNVRVLDLVDELREIKSVHEIARIRYASRLMIDALGAMLDASRPGLRVADVIGKAGASIMPRALAEISGYNVMNNGVHGFIQPPKAADDPHNFSCLTDLLEEGGPHVSLIFGRVNGYGAEIERTFFFNHVPEAARRPFDVMLEMRERASSLLKPGSTGSEIDQVCRDVLTKHGYAEPLHRTGHSFGVTNHERPFLAIGEDNVLEPGMVFSLEPGLYIAGESGFRHSDTVLITGTGFETLTPFSTTMAELTYER